MPLARRVSAVVLAIAFMLGTSVSPATAEYAETARNTWQVLDGQVRTMAVHGDRVYIGGSFTRLRDSSTGERVTRLRVAAFDRTTGELVRSFDPRANDDVRAIDVSEDGSRVFLGGDFGAVNDVNRPYLAAVDRDGGLVSGWTPTPNRLVRDLVLQGDALFVAGRFGRVDDRPRLGIARVDVSSGALDPWTANTREGRPTALALSGDGSLLYVGGSFHSLAGAQRDFLGSVETGNGQATSWDPSALCDRCRALDVAVNGSQVYAALGGPGGRVAAWDASVPDDRLWARSADGDVQVVAHHDGTVYVGGHFAGHFAGADRHQLAAVRAIDGLLLPFDPAFTGNDKPGMRALVADDDFLRVGGGFRGIETGPQRRYAEFPVE